MTKIEKNIPMPEASSRRGGSKYGFEKMEVGDSMFFQGGVATTSFTPYNSARYFQMANRVTFVCRTVEGGLRIWRVA